MHTIATLQKATSLPALETRLLLMQVLKKTRIELITQQDYQLTDVELNATQELIRRRVAGEPIAYLVGHREFFGLDFTVTPDVLIPRPETELLVELALKLTPQNSTLLDLGTGSGAIAVAIAHQRPDLKVWASDISTNALAIAQKNATTHQCAIQFTESDWYTNLPSMLWQTMVSNPPYIVAHDPHLSQGDLRFEPVNALTDHADGLTAYRHIIEGARTRLTPQGWLLVEHGYDQAKAVRDLLAQHSFNHIQSWCDIAGIERVSGAQI